MILLILTSFFIGSFGQDCTEVAVDVTADPPVCQQQYGCGCIPNGEGCIEAECTTETPIETTEAPIETTCVCEPYTGANTPAPSEAGGGGKKGSKPAGSGVGYPYTATGSLDKNNPNAAFCDCNGGVAELRYVYTGAQTATNIRIFSGKNSPYDANPTVCEFINVAPNSEVVCNLRGDGPPNTLKLALTKFSTQSPFIVTRADGSTCEGDYHTSCSSDIVGVVLSSCPEFFVTGWRDNDNYNAGTCDDSEDPCTCEDDVPDMPTTTGEFVDLITGDVCYCANDLAETTAAPVVPMRRLGGKSKSKSKSKKSKGSKSGGGLGVGECDCENGQSDLTLMYQGSGAVDIKCYMADKDGGESIGDFSGVQTGMEVTCSAAGTSGRDGKLSTNTYIEVLNAGTTTAKCVTEVHTSCSQDIVGTYGDGACGTDLIVTGWRDRNNVDPNDPTYGLECDDGFDPCDCNGTYVEEPSDPVEEPVVTIAPPTGGDPQCLCANVDVDAILALRNGVTTAAPTGGSKSKHKHKSRNRQNGYGFGSCDCDGGVWKLRFMYQGSDSPVTVTMFLDDGGIELCQFPGVSFGEELECGVGADNYNYSPNQDYYKLSKDTYVRVDDAGANQICYGSLHTSCSKDIVGWTADGCEDIIVSGWAHYGSTEECDDGFDPCDCQDCTPYGPDYCEGWEMGCEEEPGTTCNNQPACYFNEATGQCEATNGDLYQGASGAAENTALFACLAVIMAFVGLF